MANAVGLAINPNAFSPVMKAGIMFETKKPIAVATGPNAATIAPPITMKFFTSGESAQLCPTIRNILFVFID
jgi:hypothetical protein